MSGILRLESLTKGNTLKQGDKTPLKYRLFDADGENLNIVGKTAKVRLVYPDFLTIGYEKDGLTVAQDDTVTFTIDGVIPSRIYYVEIIVDDQFIFPSRADESKFTVDKSSLGTETNIIEIVGKDILIQEVKSQVDTELQPLVTYLEASEQARKEAETLREESYEQKVDTAIVEADVVEKVDNKVTELTPKINDLTAQLAQKINYNENESVGMDMLKPDIKKAINDGEFEFKINTSEIEDNAIVGKHIDGVKTVSKTINLFNKNDIIPNGYFDQNRDGAWRTDNTMVSANFIPVQPNVTYRKTPGHNYVFWDENFNYVGGVSSGRNMVTNSQTSYITFSMFKDEVDTTMVTIKEDYPDSYVPYEEKYVFGDSWGFDIEHASIENKYQDLFLRVPTPYHDGSTDEWATHQTTHPSIWQFEEKWNGFKYWMAHTPYPHENNRLENPSIAVSNDGIKWEEPQGINNPIVEAPPAPHYNSDGHIFYNGETSRLEMWWRQTERNKDTLSRELIKRVTSTDGVNWTEEELMYWAESPKSHPNRIRQAHSPSVIRHEGKYKLWFVNDYSVRYTESENGTDWEEPVKVNFEGTHVESWHINVQLHDGKYHMLNIEPYMNVIRYSSANEGDETNFSKEKDLIVKSGNEWSLDGKWLYRGAFIFKENNVMLIYGTISQQNDWLLHVQSGLDIDHLQPITERAFRFYGV